jgi:hypothetical protein
MKQTIFSHIDIGLNKHFFKHVDPDSQENGRCEILSLLMIYSMKPSFK